jgi:D-tagatose-1,6-bisphosphate aldolase subunit GatZ/KbaZ
MTTKPVHPLDEIVWAQKRGEAKGITSICSAHPTVLAAALRHARKSNSLVLIESTCNQVNQFGGYTGMRPTDFVTYLRGIAIAEGFPLEKLILGGDHLGPNVWQHEPAESAMAKSKRLIRDYVAAGYSKIHIDASIKLDDDPDEPLPIELISRRTAKLAEVSERSFEESGGDSAPRYVIGTEVPIPGGSQDTDEPIQVSAVEDTQETLETTRQSFFELGLESAWERVIAIVVQPGVEFGNNFVMDYNRLPTQALSEFIESQPVIYEAHSTDYQLPIALRQMVEDHFAILKVGPALTFAYREAILALAMIENELFSAEERSNIVEVLDQTMVDQPEHWRKHYGGNYKEQAIARKYSYSDRSRYYWPVRNVQSAVFILMDNFAERPIPPELLSQYLPKQYENIRSGRTPNNGLAVIEDKLFTLLDIYKLATKE